MALRAPEATPKKVLEAEEAEPPPPPVDATAAAASNIRGIVRPPERLPEDQF